MAHQVMTYKLGQLLSECLLHRQPIPRVHVFLLVGMDLQEEKVADKISLGQMLALRIEAFKHKIWIIIRTQCNAYYGGAAQRCFAFNASRLTVWRSETLAPETNKQLQFVRRGPYPAHARVLKNRRTIVLSRKKLDIVVPFLEWIYQKRLLDFLSQFFPACPAVPSLASNVSRMNVVVRRCWPSMSKYFGTPSGTDCV